MTESPQSAENQSSGNGVESKEVVEEQFLTINDYITDVENNLTYLRSRSTSILTICGFLLPILLGIFYFIVKDSSSIHVNIHWTIIVGIICSIIILIITIYYNIKDVLVKPPDQYLTKTDRFYMLKKIETEERISFKRSIFFWELRYSSS